MKKSNIWMHIPTSETHSAWNYEAICLEKYSASYLRTAQSMCVVNIPLPINLRLLRRQLSDIHWSPPIRELHKVSLGQFILWYKGATRDTRTEVGREHHYDITITQRPIVGHQQRTNPKMTSFFGERASLRCMQLISPESTPRSCSLYASTSGSGFRTSKWSSEWPAEWTVRFQNLISEHIIEAVNGFSH